MTRRKGKKIGRNEPCPCGSGKKFKRCHGALEQFQSGSTQEQTDAIFAAHEADEARRRSQQGRGKPIISTEFQGYRFTAVGNRLHYAKTHKTFIDFLGDYIRTELDPEWGNVEIAKPFEERHQILQWYDAICALQRRTMRRPDGEIQDMPATGVVAAYYGLAYNLYLLQHNAELRRYLVRRLKSQESFYSAYYETYVAAWFILAGFSLRLEDEEDSTRTHPEFIATRDGQSYSVEAKTRKAGKPHFDVGNQLYNALRISSQFPRIVFIDMNVDADADFDALGEHALAAIRGRESNMTIDGAPAPSAHVYVTNQPYHLELAKTNLPRVCLAAGFKVPEFGNNARFDSYTAAHKARVKYATLYDVQKAVANYSIPVTFDGEIPQFAFGEAERRFVIGRQYEIEGEVVVLESGLVSEPEKRAYLVTASEDGQRHIVSADLSDTEVAAYRAHPETFFGCLSAVTKNTEDPLDLYEFFLDGYRETSREKLLEFMRDARDFSELEKMSVEELRFAYAERLTHAAVRRRNS